MEDNPKHIHPPTDPPPASQESSQFCPKVIKFFESTNPSQAESLTCAICGPSSLTSAIPRRAICEHYVSCGECQNRVCRLLLRCAPCCRALTGEYPVCNGECENLSISMSQMLKTTNCPRCCEKLAKETCGATCTRKDTSTYKNCHQLLDQSVTVLVIHPNECSRSFPGLRPCCHFTRCQEHGKVTRGRSRRCPQCREINRPKSS